MSQFSAENQMNIDLLVKDLTSQLSWLPNSIILYLLNFNFKISQRMLAHSQTVHPSTILRRIRKAKRRMGDILFAMEVKRIGIAIQLPSSLLFNPKEFPAMTKPELTSKVLDIKRVEKEARRILRRLCESGSMLVVSPNMENAVVMRKTAEGQYIKTAVVKREIAGAFAVKDWLQCYKKGKVSCYHITTAGRAALKRLISVDRKKRLKNRAHVSSSFAEQHQDIGSRHVFSESNGNLHEVKVNLAESPLGILARRKDKSGKPFLTIEQLTAGEKLREDFEMAQLGPRVTQNWDSFLTSTGQGLSANSGLHIGPAAARARVSSAVTALGAGLSDITMRCCCFLEGLETAEKRLGWSARSGKVVLRIALQRLAEHYAGKKINGDDHHKNERQAG